MPFLILLAILFPAAAWSERLDDVRIEGDHPRLLLNSRRLKLLTREKERESIRWQQFDALMSGGARMPEPGFAQALYYQVSKNESAGRKAVEWALSPAAADLHQLALVFDWCQPLLSEPQSAALAAKLRKGLEQSTRARDVSSIRNGTLAAIALAGHIPKAPEDYLKWVVNEWWNGQMTRELLAGGASVPRQQIYALMELLHVVRDNLNLDLREAAPEYFKSLPVYHLLSHYPAAYPAAENEYRIPVYDGRREPDLNQAALSRAAELSMVSFDTNALETQFLQGWLIRDRFLMRGTFGITYEFLWANPYQPGLSVYHMPLWFHDPRSGRLMVRSSWEEDAVWFGNLDGFTQLFSEGKPVPVNPAATSKPIQLGETIIAFPKQQSRFQITSEAAGSLFVVGLKPLQPYDVEVDDEELREEQSDGGGLLELHFPPETKATVRLAPSRRPVHAN